MANPLTDPEAFQAWASNPLTQGFLLYLKERQAVLTEAWAAGQPGSHLPEPQAQAVLLGHLAGLEFEDIARHYGIEVKADGDTSKGG